MVGNVTIGHTDSFYFIFRNVCPIIWRMSGKIQKFPILNAVERIFVVNSIRSSGAMQNFLIDFIYWPVQLAIVVESWNGTVATDE